MIAFLSYAGYFPLVQPHPVVASGSARLLLGVVLDLCPLARRSFGLVSLTKWVQPCPIVASNFLLVIRLMLLSNVVLHARIA